MNKLLLIDGNSIINRAFYGIMGSKMLMTEDGTYTNAVYGFLSILFKELDDIKPEYLVVAFDLDHTLVNASHRGRRDKDGNWDLEYWIENSVLKNIMKDRLLPLVDVYREFKKNKSHFNSSYSKRTKRR